MSDATEPQFCLSTAIVWRLATSLWLVVVMTSGGLIGCGRSDRPVVQYVEGTVLLDGEPVPGATISFSPLSGEAGLPAVGLTDDRGVFRLSSTRGGTLEGGAVAGCYAVTVSKVESDDGEFQFDPGTGEPVPQKSPPPPPRRVVPEVYEDPATTPLRATVVKGRNTGDAFIFRLER